MPYDPSKTFFNDVLQWIARETFADLPPPNGAGVRAGARAYVRSEDTFYELVPTDSNPTLYFWRPEPGGSGGRGAKLLYIVAEQLATPGIQTPMAVSGTFPNVEDAVAQAIIDFAAIGAPLNADFLVMPGTYPGYRLRPGMRVSSLVNSGFESSPIPPAPSIDTPAIRYTSGIQILGSDGWVAGASLPNASHSGGKFDTGNASCVTIGSDVTAGVVYVQDALLTTTGIAINETNGASGLQIQMSNSRVEAFGGYVFNGKLCRLQTFNACRLIGDFSTSTLEGLAFFDSVLIATHVTCTGSGVTPFGGSAHCRIYNTTLISVDGSQTVTLNNEALIFVANGNGIQNSNPVSVGGSGGTIALAAGSFPGFLSAPPQIKFISAPAGISLKSLTDGVPLDSNGYVAPSGPGPIAINVTYGTEIVPLDLSAMDPGAQVDISLPDVRSWLAWSLLRIKRLDSRLDVTVRVVASALNRFDDSPTQELALPPGDSLTLVASREPSGVGRWLLTP